MCVCVLRVSVVLFGVSILHVHQCQTHCANNFVSSRIEEKQNEHRHSHKSCIPRFVDEIL